MFTILCILIFPFVVLAELMKMNNLWSQEAEGGEQEGDCLCMPKLRV